MKYSVFNIIKCTKHAKWNVVYITRFGQQGGAEWIVIRMYFKVENRLKCLTSFHSEGRPLAIVSQSGTFHENLHIFHSYLPISTWIHQYTFWALLYVVIAVNSQQPSPEECNRPWFGRKGGSPGCVRCRTGTRGDHIFFQPRASTTRYFRYSDGLHTG